ncbi:oxidoreductase [Micromonospora sp. NPDC006766]|uniref:oxidoreductase n=1 Tax=Micromonospora sp. NPDC006766 TaxID=3154778 RepID=UPI0033C3DE07
MTASIVQNARRSADGAAMDFGRVAVVTGANSGVGYHTARHLAARGATVVLACRHPGRMAEAAASIRAAHPGAAVRQVTVDLGSLRSIRAAAHQILDDHARIDVLVNNAGVMGVPRWDTLDGVEVHFGVNHLGHFALTGLLLPGLLSAPAARIVTVSSTAHRAARLDPADWPNPRLYRAFRAYAASKLANLLFAYELHRRMTSAGVAARSIASHPGWSDTKLIESAYRRGGPGVTVVGLRLLAAVVAQSAALGALPTLAAAYADMPGGAYVGPRRWLHTRGPAAIERSSDDSHDEEAARLLWSMSAELSGVDPSSSLSAPRAGLGCVDVPGPVEGPPWRAR